MCSLITTRQGVLTRAQNRLVGLLRTQKRNFNLNIESQHINEVQKQIRKAKAAISMEVQKLEEAIDRYAEAIDNANGNAKPELLKRTEEHIEAAQEILDEAQNELRKLTELQEELKDSEERNSALGNPIVTLNPVPIPKFNGDIWGWEPFWQSFERNVHSQNIDDMYKMNYLLDALQGAAKESVKHFQVAGHTYPLVIAHLKRKYGDTQALVDRLLSKLQSAKAESGSLEDQETLCEQLTSLTSQLHLHGEHIDNTFLQKQLLGKFSVDVQRQILRQKTKIEAEGMWSTMALLKSAKEFIEAELRIISQVERHGYNIGEYQGKGAREERGTTSNRKPTTFQTSAPCFYCSKTGHSAKNCNEVSSLEQRLDIMKMQKLCHNCGQKDHTTATCRKGACRLCGVTGHHPSICRTLFPNNTSYTSQNSRKPTAKTTQNQSSRVSNTNTLGSNQDLRPNEDTAVHFNYENDMVLAGQAKVLNPSSGTFEPVHIILDSGADRSFITNTLARRLHLKNIESTKLTINTFGSQQPITKTFGVTVIQIWDANGTHHTFKVARIDKITEPLQRNRLSLEDRQFLSDNELQLSINPNLTSIRPQILLNCTDLLSLLDQGLASQHILPSGYRLISSKLGYLVAGGNSQSTTNKKSKKQMTIHSVMEPEETVQSWEDFCTFESSGVGEFVGPKTEERRRTEHAIWSEFEKNIGRKEDGYYVRLPWKKEAEQLPDNKNLALRRLQALLNKLKATPEILRQYQETLQTQLKNDIIEEVDEDQAPDGGIVHYLPHRAVVTPHKNTTKLRIVYDASAHLKGAPSLNDVLHRGPVMLPKLWDILLRFRMGDVAIASDVEKAFLQVRLYSKDRDATRFLWLRDIDRPLIQSNIITYRFSRVTFGLICSPFLLAGTIKYHLQHCTKHTRIAREILNNTYVDNVIMTARSTAEAIHLYEKSKTIFEEMKMNLREFISNDDKLKQHIKRKDLSEIATQKILGILWNTNDDELIITCKYPSKEKITKRSVSEQIASIYDPLGWMTPITLHGKRFLQHLWKSDYSWDEVISQKHQQQWKEILQKVDGFQRKLNRRIAQINGSVKLIVFSDSSSIGMATCAYITSEKGAALVAGKSKLPSVKEIPTIPKMELNALTMAVRLMFSIYEAVKERLNIEELAVLSDSEIALSWISSHQLNPSTGVLVRNRVREIQRIVSQIVPPVHFGYVKTNDNPADCATRGLKNSDFENHLWWTGPSYILSPLEQWPHECKLFKLPSNDEIENARILSAGTTHTVSELLDWKRHNDLQKSQRVLAYVLRFLKRPMTQVNDNLKKKIENSLPDLQCAESSTHITATEMKTALRVLIRNHQKVHFPTERQISLKQLKIREDEQGILRCKGRLGNANLSPSAKHPCIIANKTDLARLIVLNAHSPLHCGISHTIANVRQHFWIPKLRQMVRSIITRCVPCQKMNNLPFRYPEMDSLPEQRVRRSRPFEHIGIDYFGPLSIRRNEEAAKAYGIILTCATTRLIHLEQVPDMSTPHLLLALRRFFARRGIPASITSDNGSNFLLAEQILRDLVIPTTNDVSFIQSVATKGIEWKTIIPYAPWQGGLYERMIKSIKHSLYKVMQRKVPDEKTLETLLVEIEGCINTRPLTYQEEKWDETPALRPIDFIQRDMVITYPFESVGMDKTDPDYLPAEGTVILHTRQQAEEALKTSHELIAHFWKIWSQQYLAALRESHKLQISNQRSTPKTPSVGDVVLITEPLLPRNTWKMGRIVKVHYSSNDVIRDVEIKMPNGRTTRRPVNLLIPLELEDTSSPEGKEANTNTPLPKPRYNLRPRPHQRDTSAANINCFLSHLPTTFPPTFPAPLTPTPSSLIDQTKVFHHLCDKSPDPKISFEAPDGESQNASTSTLVTSKKCTTNFKPSRKPEERYSTGFESSPPSDGMCTTDRRSKSYTSGDIVNKHTSNQEDEVAKKSEPSDSRSSTSTVPEKTTEITLTRTVERTMIEEEYTNAHQADTWEKESLQTTLQLITTTRGRRAENVALSVPKSQEEEEEEEDQAIDDKNVKNFLWRGSIEKTL